MKETDRECAKLVFKRHGQHERSCRQATIPLTKHVHNVQGLLWACQWAAMVKHVKTPIQDDELVGFQCPVTLKDRKNVIGLLTQNYTQYFRFGDIKNKDVTELAETLQKNLKNLIDGK